MPRNPAPASSDAQTPDANWRSLVSLGLVIHFFGVIVALASYTAASPLEIRVLEVLPYLKWLDFDFTHVYPSPANLHQTHAGASDVDFTAEITTRTKGGDEVKVSLPPADLWPPIRRRRYQALANVMGSIASSEDKKSWDSVLPRAFGAAVMLPRGSKVGDIVVTAHNLPTMEDFDSPQADRKDPNSQLYFRKAYEAKLIATKDQVSVQKPSAAFEVAPVEKKPVEKSSGEKKPGEKSPGASSSGDSGSDTKRTGAAPSAQGAKP